MKKNILSVFIFITIFTLQTYEVCHAFWIWRPKEKGIVNPKFAAKDSPGEQFEYAMRFFKKKEFKRAAEEFVRLTDKYKDSDIAPESQYYAGRAYEEIGKYWFAYENYQKTLKNYPYTKRMEEIIEREYNIANIFQTKHAPKLVGNLELNTALDKAVAVYKKIVENSSYGKFADKSLFKMAECYRRQRKYNEAIDTYEILLTDYPNSKLLQEAKYQLAYTTYEASLDPDYAQESTDDALTKFERIARSTAIPAIAEEADKALDLLRNRKAESLMNVAVFYEKQRKYKSALIYYKEILSKYPDTDAAGQAKDKTAHLEKRIKK